MVHYSRTCRLQGILKIDPEMLKRKKGFDYRKKSRTHLEQAKEKCPPRGGAGVSKVERVAEEPEGGGTAREAARTALCPPGRAPGHT